MMTIFGGKWEMRPEQTLRPVDRPPRGMLIAGIAGFILTIIGSLVPGMAWDAVGTAGCLLTIVGGWLFLGQLLAAIFHHWWPE